MTLSNKPGCLNVVFVVSAYHELACSIASRSLWGDTDTCVLPYSALWPEALLGIALPTFNDANRCWHLSTIKPASWTIDDASYVYTTWHANEYCLFIMNTFFIPYSACSLFSIHCLQFLLLHRLTFSQAPFCPWILTEASQATTRSI